MSKVKIVFTEQIKFFFFFKNRKPQTDRQGNDIKKKSILKFETLLYITFHCPIPTNYSLKAIPPFPPSPRPLCPHSYTIGIYDLYYASRSEIFLYKPTILSFFIQFIAHLENSYKQLYCRY